MEPVYGQIMQKGYGERLLRWVRCRTGVICTTERGMRELKRYPWGAENLAFDYQARELLAKAGFAPVMRYWPAMDGETSFCFGEDRYVLEDYVPPMGEETAQAYRQAGAATLASLHLCAHGLEVDAVRSGFGRLPETIWKRRRELIRCKNWIRAQGGLSPMDTLVLKDLKYYLARLDQAAEILADSAYAVLCEKSAAQGVFCHGAYKGDNLRLDSSGRLRVTGFERATGDLVIADLADLLRRNLRRGADGEQLLRLLAAYESQRPLSAEERPVLIAMLIYPHRFLKLVNATYNKRRVCVSQASLQNMRECVEGRNREEAVLTVLCKNLC